MRWTCLFSYFICKARCCGQLYLVLYYPGGKDNTSDVDPGQQNLMNPDYLSSGKNSTKNIISCDFFVGKLCFSLHFKLLDPVPRT